MPVERRRAQVTITTVPRKALPDTRHREIDAVLRDLKFCSRRLKSVLDSFKDELRTLERLYYKCKNQHRMALFFKRVSEMRRYGRRLSELVILEHLDLLRASFVGLDHTNDHKALRGSWSHLPEKPCVYFLTERLTACSMLVSKMRKRLENAYHHFTLAMQTGAFVQLIVLFVAISSRMSVLSLQLDEALRSGISTCNRLLAIIHPTGAQATVPQQPPSEQVTSYSSHVEQDVPSEDTGQPVSKCDPVDASTLVVENLSSKIEVASEMRVMLPPSGPANADDNATLYTAKKATVKGKSRVKKAKKKFDEIDEIFGF